MQPVTPRLESSIVVRLPHTDPLRWRALVEQFARAHPGERARIERGWRVVAQRTLRLTSDPGTYLVPGSAPGTLYVTRALSCTCPDATVRGVRCKHQWAVELLQAAIADEASRLVSAINAEIRYGGLDPAAGLARLSAFYARYCPPPPPEPEPEPPDAGVSAAPASEPEPASEPAPLQLRPEATIDPRERWTLTPAGEAYLAGYARARAGRPPAWLRDTALVPAHMAGYRDGRRAA